MTSSTRLITQLHQQVYTARGGLWHLSQSLLMGTEHVFAMNVSSGSAQMAKHFKLQPSQKSQTTPQPIEKVATNAWLLERVSYQLA